MSKIELLKFQAKFAKELAEQAFRETTFSPEDKKNEMLMDQLITGLKRLPFGSQVEQGVLPIYTALEKFKVGILNAEMGTGKTQMAYSAAYLYIKNKRKAKNKMLFLTAGGKHLPKMEKEARAIFGDNVVVYVVSNKFAPKKIKKNEVYPEDIASIKIPEGKIGVFLLSKDTAKMDLSEKPAFSWGDKCPGCNQEILPKNWKLKEKKLPEGWKRNKYEYYRKIKGQPYNCPHCNANLTTKVAKNIWEGESVFPSKKDKLEKKGNRIISVGQRLRKICRKTYDKIFDCMIVDEVHEMQSADSLQGRAYRDLIKTAGATLIMTGTLSNGYPSSIFYILQAILPKYFKDLGYGFYDVGKFVDHFGAKKSEKAVDVIKKVGSKVSVKVSELPKISDRIVSIMAPFTAWIKMEDLNLKMPPYSEEAIIVPMEPEVRARFDEWKEETIKLLKAYNPKLVKSFAQRLMYLQNNPTISYNFEFDAEVLKYSPEGEIIGSETQTFSKEFIPFDEDKIFNKERTLIDKIKEELKQGRKCLVYSIYNEAAKLSTRLHKVLSEELEKETSIQVLPDNISGEKIEPWIEEHPSDVLIASPIKLATGLDLVQFPTIIFYETGTNLRILQQASRRSWRAVGQDHPVKVYFLAYEGIQASILDLMAKKMRAAAVIEGTKVVEGQIASVFDDDVDFTKALNDIANELEKVVQPDFSHATIEEGKMRPATKLETRWEELKELILNNSSESNQVSENEIIESTETEIIVEEKKEVIQEIKQPKSIFSSNTRIKKEQLIQPTLF